MDGTLRHWPGDFGLPSFDRESLFLMTYARINKCKIGYEVGSQPYWRAIPTFCDKNKNVYTQQDQIIAALKKTMENEKDTDEIYYSDQIPGIDVFNKYVSDEMSTGLLLAFWNDTNNYEIITKPFYCGVIMFPLNRFYLYGLKKKAYDKVTLLSRRISVPVFVELKVEKVNQVLSDLVFRLGENRYMMGDHPTTLDCVAYSYIAPLYYAPSKSCKFRLKLLAYHRLVDYITFMTRTYFPEVETTYKYVKPITEDDETTPIWQMILAGCFATSAMFFFAYTHGILRRNI